MSESEVSSDEEEDGEVEKGGALENEERCFKE